MSFRDINCVLASPCKFIVTSPTLLLSLPCVTKLLKRDVAEPELKATIFIFFYIYLGEYVLLVLSKQTWQIYTCFG